MQSLNVRKNVVKIIKSNKKVTFRLGMLIAFVCLLVANNFIKVNADTQQQTTEAVQVKQKDGEYTVKVTMEGGSGRATIESPTTLVVKKGKAYAKIIWSSPNYDYMILEKKTYYPENKEGNSEFLLPVLAFDKPIKVKADTTAMSVPHEIEYTLTFKKSSISGTRNKNVIFIKVGIISLILVAIVGILLVLRKKKRGKKNETT